MIRVTRTIRAGHPDIARVVEKHTFVGDVWRVRYYENTATGETFKTIEIRPYNNAVEADAAKKAAAPLTLSVRAL